MKNFKEFELTQIATAKIFGGNSGGNASEDGPITTLGTITNEGDG
jgi:hypothetical protein